MRGSRSANRDTPWRSASCEARRSDSISRSEAVLATRNLLVSSVAISDACWVAECDSTRSLWWELRAVRVRESSVYPLAQRSKVGSPWLCILFNALSDSRIRKSRACCSVARLSLMRETASLSGWMLKLPIVWWMSWVLCQCCTHSHPWGVSSHRRGIFVEKHFGGVYSYLEHWIV